MCGSACPCGCRKNHPVRGHAVLKRQHPKIRKSGQKRRFSGYLWAGAGAGDYHLFQTGPAFGGGYGDYAAGHSRPCGLLGGDGAGITGTGCGGSGDQRQRRGAGAYAHALEAS